MIGRVVGDPAFLWTIRVSLAALFATAAFHKARDLRGFATTLRNYRLLPSSLSFTAAVLIVAAEIAITAALLAPAPSAFGPVAAGLLLIVYCVAIAVNLLRGRRDVDCGCLGPAHRQPISEWLLLRNGVAAIAAFLAGFPPATRLLLWTDIFSIATAALTFALIWTSANRLMQSWPSMRALRPAR
jgi:hypothetical protein